MGNCSKTCRASKIDRLNLADRRDRGRPQRWLSPLVRLSP